MEELAGILSEPRYTKLSTGFYVIRDVTITSTIHLLLFITRKYTIINANLEVINAKIRSFYPIDIQ